MELPVSIPLAVAALTVFLTFTVGLSYAVEDNFLRTRFVMTMFFVFIVFTLTISFWPYAMITFPYSATTLFLGLLVGYFVGVREAEKKMQMQGIVHYMEHFSHIHVHELRGLTWWSLINFYSVMSGLLLINLVGLSTVIFHGQVAWVIITSSAGAFLVGTIFPYLVHLWKIRGLGI